MAGQWRMLHIASILLLSTWADSLSIDANSLVFSDDLNPEFLPCRSWIQVCEEGESTIPTPRCTTHEEYARYLSEFFVRCPIQQQQKPATQVVFPGVCAKVDGRCRFSHTQPSCVQSCRFFNHQCTTLGQFFADPVKPSENCPQQFPKSSDVCIPEDGGCAMREPCVLYIGVCGRDYVCGSLADYGLFLTLPIPPCAPPPRARPLPPGECVYQDGRCEWSECHSWLVCGTSWTCGSAYDHELSQYYPRRRCAYDPLALPPADPGRCEYSVELRRCAFTEVCDGGKQFQECGSPCQKTCDGINVPAGYLVCPTVCQRGCFCPAGTVLHQAQCIPRHQCPCKSA